MKNQMLHTPEGVRDIYSDEYEKKLILESKIWDIFKTYGYHPIQTPTFEFFDIFGKEIGTTPSKDLYKFFDKEGNTMVLRPDFTPSIARCASKYYMDEIVPIRFCYKGNRFINSRRFQGFLSESTQCGAELIGDDTVQADAELLAMTVNIMKKAGLSEFQISVGHVDYLNGLFEASSFDSDTEEEIKNLLMNRNFFGVEDLIADKGLNEDLIYLYSLLKDVMMTQDKIIEAKQHAASYPKVLNALERLEQLENILKLYKVNDHVYYELALISSFTYYTGIIFAGYTYGSGEAIVTGGRYDTLLSAFGKDAPAIGFAVVVDQIMNALSRQGIEIPYKKNTTWIIYKEKAFDKALNHSNELRFKGFNVEMLPLTADKTKDAYEKFAAENGITDIVYFL